MNLGKLSFTPAAEATDLLATPTKGALTELGNRNIWVSKIDPNLADTAAFCKHYDIGPGISANCVIVEAKRADKTWYAACLILATDRVDINGVVRRELDARKISFAPMDTAVSLSGMEYGGITPIGLPKGWPILIDTKVMEQDEVVIGSGVRGSKILVAPSVLAGLPNAKVMDIAKR